jgi:NADH/NAD ratio-sensing transcriptional regulator Rex
MTLEIPEVVINRLPVYARALNELAARGETVVSSQALGTCSMSRRRRFART